MQIYAGRFYIFYMFSIYFLSIYCFTSPPVRLGNSKGND
jgi:hypothetical protein